GDGSCGTAARAPALRLGRHRPGHALRLRCGVRRAGVAGSGRSGVSHQLTRGHLVAHVRAVMELVAETPRLEYWGGLLGAELLAGRRLLVAGNGGSAAQAQHLTGELVGRYRVERQALSAIPLLADAASLTA